MKFVRSLSLSNFYFVKNKLFRTHVVQTCILMGTGDVIAQTVMEKSDYHQINFLRTTKFALLGLFFVGPCLTTWYTFLNAQIPSTTKLFSTAFAKKLLIDQFLFTPIFLPACVTALNLINGTSFKYAKKELHLSYKDIMVTNYVIWLPVHLFNYGIKPMKLRIMFNQSIAILWNAYLSFKIQGDTFKKEKRHY